MVENNVPKSIQRRRHDCGERRGNWKSMTARGPGNGLSHVVCYFGGQHNFIPVSLYLQELITLLYTDQIKFSLGYEQFWVQKEDNLGVREKS